ncbi:hypothetical protein MTO96_002360 [Rhipicephalus appendiculatus]
MLAKQAMPQTLVESCPVSVSLDPKTSNVPLTLGPSCKRDVQADLVQTTEACLEDGLARSVFQNGQHGKFAKRGPAVALEYMGTDCREACQQIAARLTPGTHYISPQEPETTKKQIEAAFNTTQCMFS